MGMYSLLLDCSGYRSNIALIKENKIIDSFTRQLEKNLVQFLIIDIQDLLEKNNVKKYAIEKIYLVDGPGTFTGMRTAAVVAKTWIQCFDNCKLYTIDKFLYQAKPNCLSVISVNKKSYFIKIIENSKFVEEKIYELNIEEYNKLVGRITKYPIVDSDNINCFSTAENKLNSFIETPIENLKLKYLKDPC